VTELTIRPGGADDAALVTGLMNAVEAAGDGGHEFGAGEIRTIMSGTGDLVQNSRLVLTAAGALAGAGIVSPPSPGTSRIRMDGGVHPDWRGRGIGRMLLTWQLRRSTEIHAARAPGAMWTVGAGACVADESADRLFRRFGLVPARYFTEMFAPTVGDRPVPLPDGIRVAEYTDSLRAAVYDSHMEAFAEHWGHEARRIEEWTARNLDAEEFRGDLSRVALDGDQIAAYLLAYDGAGNRLYIGTVGTRRPWRKRGLASALLADSLAAAAADGKATASLGVDTANPTGAVGVYERLGFTAQHSAFAVYNKVLAASLSSL
jgi:mycothiol synthase